MTHVLTLVAAPGRSVLDADLVSALAAHLHKIGAKFYDWASEPERVMARLVVSFATPETDVAKFIEAAKG